MQRLQRGERKCFEMLYERYHIKLFNYLLRLCKDAARAEDILHDCFIKVIEHPGKFNPQFRFSTWLYTIATNLYSNEMRNRQNRQRIQKEKLSYTDTFYTEEHNRIDRTNFRKELEEFLDNTTEENRLLFTLRFSEELTVPEISQVLDCPEGTVKSRLFYLMKKMAIVLKAYNPAE